MALDGLGLVFEKRDNSGGAVVFTEENKGLKLLMQEATIRQKSSAAKVAKYKGLTNTELGKFWEKDHAYAQKVRNKMLDASATAYRLDPSGTDPEVQSQLDKIKSEGVDASWFSQTRGRWANAKRADLIKYPDLYEDSQKGLQALDKWENEGAETAGVMSTAPELQRKQPVNLFKAIPAGAPTDITTEGVADANGRIAVTHTKGYDDKDGEKQANDFLMMDSKESRYLTAMGNDYAEKNYAGLPPDKQAEMAHQYAVHLYKEVQKTKTAEAYSKTTKSDQSFAGKQAAEKIKVKAAWQPEESEAYDPAFSDSEFKGKLDSGQRNKISTGRLYFNNTNVQDNSPDYFPLKNATTADGKPLSKTDKEKQVVPSYWHVTNGKPDYLVAVIPKDGKTAAKVVKIPFKDAQAKMDIEFDSYENLLNKAGVSAEATKGGKEVTYTGTKTKVEGGSKDKWKKYLRSSK